MGETLTAWSAKRKLVLALRKSRSLVAAGWRTSTGDNTDLAAVVGNGRVSRDLAVLATAS